MFGPSMNLLQEGRREPGDTSGLCELFGRMPPEFGLRPRGLCSVMCLPQERPAAACFVVLACGPGGCALKSNLSLLQLITFSQKPSGQSCWPLSPVSLELLVHPPSSNKTVPVPEEGDPILLVSPSLLWDWKVNSNRFGERTIPWCHLRPTPICFG